MDSNVINSLVVKIGKLNPLQKSFISDSLSTLTLDEIRIFEAYLDYCYSQDISPDFLASSYDLIVKDTFREQVFFQRHGRYRHSSYREVANSVYHNDEYMSKYMFGLALSTFLWPNHMAMHRFFIRTLPKEMTGSYLEIGPGHGFYFMQAMQYSGFEQFQAVDISATSVAMTTDIIKSGCFGTYENYAIERTDFLAWGAEHNFDCVVMAEVLEHVEKPEAFLKQICKFAKPDAHIFVTTCINAPAIDHIYLYPDVESLRTQIKDSGLNIVEELLVPYVGKTIEQSISAKLPINIAMVLKK